MFRFPPGWDRKEDSLDQLAAVWLPHTGARLRVQTACRDAWEAEGIGRKPGPPEVL